MEHLRPFHRPAGVNNGIIKLRVLHLPPVFSSAKLGAFCNVLCCIDRDKKYFLLYSLVKQLSLGLTEQEIDDIVLRIATEDAIIRESWIKLHLQDRPKWMPHPVWKWLIKRMLIIVESKGKNPRLNGESDALGKRM